MRCLAASCFLFSYPVSCDGQESAVQPPVSEKTVMAPSTTAPERVYKFAGSLWPKLPHAATVHKEADGIDITGRTLSDKTISRQQCTLRDVPIGDAARIWAVCSVWNWMDLAFQTSNCAARSCDDVRVRGFDLSKNVKKCKKIQ